MVENPHQKEKRITLKINRVIAQIHNATQDEIMSMVDKNLLAEIKKTDPNPQIRVYCIGEEGESHGTVLGKGKQVIKYLQTAMIQLFNALPLQTKSFDGHGEDTNSHANRTNVGYVIGKALNVVDSKLRSLAAIYILPAFRNKEMDIASIEAEIELAIDSEGNAYCDSFKEVSGIALAHSSWAKPAFRNATLTHQIQAYSKESNPMPISASEVKEAIRKGEIKIVDILSEKELETEPTIKALIDKVVNPVKDEANRYQKLYDTERVEKSNLEIKLKEADKVTAKSKLSTLFESEAKSRNLNDEQKKYIAAINEDFTVNDPAKFDLEYKTFLDKNITRFATLFPDKVTKTDPENKNLGGGKDKAEEKQDDGMLSSDYLDKTKNELIP